MGCAPSLDSVYARRFLQIFLPPLRRCREHTAERCLERLSKSFFAYPICTTSSGPQFRSLHLSWLDVHGMALKERLLSFELHLPSMERESEGTSQWPDHEKMGTLCEYRGRGH